MKSWKGWLATGLLVALNVSTGRADTLNGHRVRLDAHGKLLSWVEPQSQAYDRVIRLAVQFLEHGVPPGPGGLPLYYTYSTINSTTLRPIRWPNNPAGMRAMLVDSARRYYAYSADRKLVRLVTHLLDYQLKHGMTPAGWDWAGVPYASSEAGSHVYQGAHANEYWHKPNVGDGWHAIEPDKVGELGYGFLQWYEMTGKVRYRQAALACATELARHEQPGDATHSPWPFRVKARSGQVLDGYSSNVIGPIRLFTALLEADLGDASQWRRARRTAWDWLRRYPLRNQHWSGYFEDVYTFPAANDWNQYSPMETARYLLRHPHMDAHWRRDVPRLLGWVRRTLIVNVPREPALQWGAQAVSEQIVDMNKMGSHTARYAAVNALWYARTGDRAARRRAFYSLNWATYMCHRDGRVVEGPIDQSMWFTDGYGDFIRHFLIAMAAVPQWAPPHQDHLLASTSIVRRVSYSKGQVEYRTYQPVGTDVLRLNFRPRRIEIDGRPVTGHSRRGNYTIRVLADGDVVIHLHRSRGRRVRIEK